MRRFSWCLIMVMSIGGCATIPWPAVMYSPQGNWLVVSYDRERPDAIRRAYGAASNHCAQQQKRMMLLGDVTIYQGPLSQEMHEAAKVAEEAMTIYGHLDEWRLGQSISSRTGEYRTTIEFRCQ